MFEEKTHGKKVQLTVYNHCGFYIVYSGGVPITVTGENVDSVAEPIMVVTVITNSEQSVYYQVHKFYYLNNSIQKKKL